MASHEAKNIAASTEVREFDRATIEMLSIPGGTVARFTLRTVWKWSKDVKSLVKTEWRED